MALMFLCKLIESNAEENMTVDENCIFQNKFKTSVKIRQALLKMKNRSANLTY